MGTIVSPRSRIPSVFTVTSDGRNAEGLTRTLEQKNFRVSWHAEEVMQSPQFIITSGRTYQLGIIYGDEISDEKRSTANVREEAKKRGWLTPPAEVAHLTREKISDNDLERMGVWWLMIMHEPIEVSDDGPGFLALDRTDGGRWLAYYDRPDCGWDRGDGFVFVVPLIGS